MAQEPEVRGPSEHQLRNRSLITGAMPLASGKNTKPEHVARRLRSVVNALGGTYAGWTEMSN